MDLTTSIKQMAIELGFDLVGITTAHPPPHRAEFGRWLAEGFHGEMTYMARQAERRMDPQKVLPGAQSVVVVGLNYNPGNSGPVARYAAAAHDYHEVMAAKLNRLAALVQGIWYVDTGPILERDFAQRAGIGFIGKHTNLISRQFGNWVVVGEVLTALKLAPDPPEREFCGTCTRCLQACPTRAIVAPYRLDARRCISYLTIELKGVIPVELRPLIGSRLFGCDDCLEACPWNRFARPAVARRALPPLVEFLSWDARRFAEFFRGTPIERLRRDRFLRNVCVVLGNSGERSALPALERACGDASVLVREHARWAAERIRQS